MFQRFVQRGGAPGSGLGLAIAKHLVDLVGGDIWFESDPTKKPGTTCVVRMDLPPCDPPDCPVKDTTGDVSKIEEPITFLIIDDIKMNRAMLKRRIQKAIAPNCTITEAATGEQALEICGKQKFDVIIVDQVSCKSLQRLYWTTNHATLTFILYCSRLSISTWKRLVGLWSGRIV
jgi:hypothetical protein